MKVLFEFTTTPIRYYEGCNESEIDGFNKSIISKFKRFIELPYQPQVGMFLSLCDFEDIVGLTKDEVEELEDIMTVKMIYMLPEYLIILLKKS
jgi:hypothetical protein